MKKPITLGLLLITSGLVYLLIGIASCTNDDVIYNDDCLCQDADSIFEDQAICDLDQIANYPGTACCVSGPVKAAPGDSLSYEYHTNLKNGKVTWTVACGSIILTNGQNTSTATFTFGDDFTEGCIQGHGENEKQICSSSIRINKWD